MLIDAGFPSRDEVLTSLRRLGFGPPDVPGHPADPRPRRPSRLGHLVRRRHARHPGVLPCRRGRPLQAGVPAAGLPDRPATACLAATVDQVVAGDRPQGVPWCAPASPPPGADRGRRGDPARPAADRAHPGHTGGHCSYVVDGVLVSGDALVTGHPLAPVRAPQLCHPLFNHDERGCVRSLAAPDCWRPRRSSPATGGWDRPYPGSRAAGDTGLNPQCANVSRRRSG